MKIKKHNSVKKYSEMSKRQVVLRTGVLLVGFGTLLRTVQMMIITMTIIVITNNTMIIIVVTIIIII